MDKIWRKVIMDAWIRYPTSVKANDKCLLSVWMCSRFICFLWLYSQLCWSWRRWTGQVREVRIITTWWPPILHTYNRMVTADNVKADDDTKEIVQATHIPLSSQEEFDTQDAAEGNCWNPLCMCAPLHTLIRHKYIISSEGSFWPLDLVFKVEYLSHNVIYFQWANWGHFSSIFWGNYKAIAYHKPSMVMFTWTESKQVIWPIWARWKAKRELGGIFSHASGNVGLSEGLLVHHFGRDWNISITFGWIAM